MNKNFRKTLVGIILVPGAVALISGCGKQVEDNDKRPAIWLSIFNGGYGREWIDNIVKDYNEEHPNNKYKISIRSSKDEFSAIQAAIQSGTAIYDMFYSNSGVYKLIDGDYLECIDDVWDSKPDDNRTIREMMYNVSDYEAAYSDSKGHLYAVPQQESIRTFVYDHDLFLKYGLLFGRDGSFIETPNDPLSVGKDGVEGTYDDGHPTSEDEWEAMVIKADGIFGNAFNYTGKFGMYTNTIYEMVAAQYDGVENYMLNWTLDGTYDFLPDYGGTQTISNENGYMTSRFTGRKVALEFMDKYLALKDPRVGQNNYVNPKSSGLSYSHTDAQNDFVINSAQNKQGQQNAMLVEGDWWENEAKPVFIELEQAGYSNYKFRTHNYRYMTLPYFAGQKEAKNVYVAAESMYLCLRKQTDAVKCAICKDFMTFSYKEKYLTEYTVLTGGVVPFDVSLSEEQKAKLSPFTKNFLELYQDREHNVIINTQILDCASIKARGGLVSTSTTKVGNQSYYMILNGLYYLSAQQYFDGMYERRHGDWAASLEQYETYIASRK